MGKDYGGLSPSPQACKRESGVTPAYIVRQYVKVVHISPGYDACMNLDEEMVVKSSTVYEKSNIG